MKKKLIDFYRNHLIWSLFLNFVLVSIVLVGLFELTGYEIIKTCSSVGSYKEAQDALKEFPRLDGNKDGIACNNLK